MSSAANSEGKTMNLARALVSTGPVACMALLLVGCTSLEKSEAMDTERLLAASGFKMKFADTAARREQVKNLPQRKVSHLNRDGKLVFVYADSRFCKCLYVGSEANYQELEKLRLQRDIALEESVAAEDAAIGWDGWGSWD